MPVPELNNIPARNITPDMETGLGSWTDDEIARAIQEGIRKDGSALFPIMPYMDFSRLDDQDVGAIVVYLRTLKPVHNVLPARNLPFPLEYIVKTIPKPLATRQTSHPSATAEQRGKYLVDNSGCGGCHTAADEQGQPLPELAFGGGGMFTDPAQGGKVFFSPNITQDPSGIQHYDEALFMQTMRTGSVSNRKLHPIMPTMYFKNMTDDDLRDVWAFVKTVPAVKHRVSNSDPPTPCPLCKQSHGLGNLNVAAAK
jgi:mono/diheme cytochrome c family protein